MARRGALYHRRQGGTRRPNACRLARWDVDAARGGGATPRSGKLSARRKRIEGPAAVESHGVGGPVRVHGEHDGRRTGGSRSCGTRTTGGQATAQSMHRFPVGKPGLGKASHQPSIPFAVPGETRASARREDARYRAGRRLPRGRCRREGLGCDDDEGHDDATAPPVATRPFCPARIHPESALVHKNRKSPAGRGCCLAA